MVDIKNNLEDVRKRIKNAAEGAARNPSEIKLIAVSKTKPAADINEAIKNGVTDIGENKVQEIMDKFDSVEPVNWHFIGHLQRNKVKYIVDKVAMIHSVDSLRLAREIDLRAVRCGRTMDVLIQINTADEENKYGVAFEEALPLIREILNECGSVNIKGLMGVVPIEEEAGDSAVHFRRMKELFDRVSSQCNHERLEMKYLSMGMTNDFETAISEGSSMVRVGTAIFGERNYTK